MIRAVLDTNVLASALTGADMPTSAPGELFRRWRKLRFRLVLSEHILTELERTLNKPYYAKQLTPAQSWRALRAFRKGGELTAIRARLTGEATQPADDLVLATAVSAKARYLVTGDKKLLALGQFRGITILDPAAFLAVLNQQRVER